MKAILIYKVILSNAWGGANRQSCTTGTSLMFIGRHYKFSVTTGGMMNFRKLSLFKKMKKNQSNSSFLLKISILKISIYIIIIQTNILQWNFKREPFDLNSFCSCHVRLYEENEAACKIYYSLLWCSTQASAEIILWMYFSHHLLKIAHFQ